MQVPRSADERSRGGYGMKDLEVHARSRQVYEADVLRPSRPRPRGAVSGPAVSLVEPDGARVPLPNIHFAYSSSPACDGDEALHQSTTNATRPLTRLDENPDQPDASLVRRI